MFLGFLYKSACTYARLRQTFALYVYSPLQNIKHKAISDNSIIKATIIDLNDFGNTATEQVIYKLSWFDYFYNVVLMWFLFGERQWIEYERQFRGLFKIGDPRISRDNVYMHVTLANGKEYLTNQAFDVYDLSHFSTPQGKYLCVLLGHHNITKFYKRFASSWNALKLRAIDMALLGMHLDSTLHSAIMNMRTVDMSLTTIDDDTFEERVFQNETLVRF